MNKLFPLLCLGILVACHDCMGQEKETVDWEAEYQKLLKTSPAIKAKIISGQTTRKDVILWLQKNKKGFEEKNKINAGKTVGGKKASPAEDGIFQKKLEEMVRMGKITAKEAADLAGALNQSQEKLSEKGKNRTPAPTSGNLGEGKSGSAPPEKKKEKVDWQAAYEKLMENPAARQKILDSGATREQVIQFLAEPNDTQCFFI